MEEIWKDVKGYEGLYQVSNLGRVRSLGHYGANGTVAYFQHGKILKSRPDKDGYNLVCLYKEKKGKNKRVHRLVAQAFIPNPMNKPTINHKNGIRNDNRVQNLEWATMSENQLHAFMILKRKHRVLTEAERRKMFYSRRKKVIQYDEKMNKISIYESMKEAEKKTGIFSQSIGRCCRGEQKHAGGFIWKWETKKE